MNRNLHPQLVTLYAEILPTLREVAKSNGYALALHGSMTSDLDLVAVPWTENAVSEEEVAESLREVLCGALPEKLSIRHEIFKNVGAKPHGRKSYAIYLVDGAFEPYVAVEDKPYIDLSVMPRVVIPKREPVPLAA